MGGVTDSETVDTDSVEAILVNSDVDVRVVVIVERQIPLAGERVSW